LFNGRKPDYTARIRVTLAHHEFKVKKNCVFAALRNQNHTKADHPCHKRFSSKDIVSVFPIAPIVRGYTTDAYQTLINGDKNTVTQREKVG